MLSRAVLDRFRLKRELKAWRDEHRLIATALFEQSAADLIAQLDAEIVDLPAREVMAAQASFIGRRVDPTAREIGFAVADRLVHRAEAALLDLTGRRLVWSRYPLPPPPGPDLLELIPGAGAVADLLGGLPFIDAGALHRRAADRLRRRSAARVIELLLRGAPKRPAMLERYCVLLTETARSARDRG